MSKMEVTTCAEAVEHIKPFNDALKMCSAKLKAEESCYQFGCMGLSLVISGIESIKIQMGYEKNRYFKLSAVVLGIICGGLNAYIRFKNYSGRLEEITQGTEKINVILTTLREHDELTHEIKCEYLKAVELVEQVVTPTERALFLKTSTSNLVAISKAQLKYRAALEKLNKKIPETELCSSSVSSDDTPPSPKKTKEDLPTIFEDAP
jgi:hypothetical protein